MMIFKTDERKVVVVWDKEKDKRLAKFVDGQFETDDQRTADILIEQGFEYEGEIGGDDDLAQLRERGKELGIPRAVQMGAEKLKAAIEAKEIELAGKVPESGE